tara:strand:+ start:1479 stop:1718 length:240 start_codon:yes stop_codon:yes gene_type:complete
MMFRTEKVKQEIDAPCCITLTFNKKIDVEKDDVFEYHGRTYCIQHVEVESEDVTWEGLIGHHRTMTNPKHTTTVRLALA